MALPIVTHASFKQFVAKRTAIVLVGNDAAIHFKPNVAAASEIASYFRTEHRGALGTFDPREVPTPRWLASHVAPLFLGLVPDEAPEGFYLFRSGQVLAFHPGVRAPSFGDSFWLNLAAAFSVTATSTIARAVIDDFEAALKRDAQPPPPRPKPPPQKPDPYAVLNVSPSASDEEVKRAYKAAIRANHPDRVAEMSDDIRRLAADKTRAINEAHDEILLFRAARR